MKIKTHTHKEKNANAKQDEQGARKQASKQVSKYMESVCAGQLLLG